MKRLLAGLIVSLCAVFMTASVAQAATTPTPQYTPGNPTCPTAGLLWSHKWDPPVAGWNDAGHKVHVSADLKTVDAIDMAGTYDVLVIVKGGDAANIYTFESIDNVSGLNMQSPLNNGGNVPVISHVTLCKYSPDGPPPPPPVYDCDGNLLPPGSTPPTYEECNPTPPPPTCANTPSLCPPVVVPPTPRTVPPPPVPPKAVVTPPALPEPPCVKGKSSLRLKRTVEGNWVTYRAKGRFLSKFQWRLDGKRLKGANTVREVSFTKQFLARKHIIQVKATGNECVRLRAEKLIKHEKRRLIPPRFTG